MFVLVETFLLLKVDLLDVFVDLVTLLSLNSFPLRSLDVPHELGVVGLILNLLFSGPLPVSLLQPELAVLGLQAFLFSPVVDKFLFVLT